jgi:hypothetical protein
MKHRELTDGILRAYLDGELEAEQASPVEQHLEVCSVCREQAGVLAAKAACAHEALDGLLQSSQADGAANGWAAFLKKREDTIEDEWTRWTPWKVLSLAGGGAAITALIMVLTVAPVRGWAESLLAVFRVQHFTVLELNPSDLKAGLQNDQFVNQEIGRVLSDEVVVTQQPQKLQSVADAAAATRLAGFPVRLLAGETPDSLLLETGAAMQMKLNRGRLQSILDEAGRSDLQLPASVDGATLGVRIPAGILAFYGNCGNAPARLLGGASGQSAQPDDTCVTLKELPSPIVSAPQAIDPGQIAQIALQFLGMSANDAANFTQTVDWTSTLVLPVVRGKSSYEQVYVNGNEGALIRPASARQSKHFTLMWVDNGIVYGLGGTGDDVTAVNLGSQVE